MLTQRRDVLFVISDDFLFYLSHGNFLTLFELLENGTEEGLTGFQFVIRTFTFVHIGASIMLLIIVNNFGPIIKSISLLLFGK